MNCKFSLQTERYSFILPVYHLFLNLAQRTHVTGGNNCGASFSLLYSSSKTTKDKRYQLQYSGLSIVFKPLCGSNQLCLEAPNKIAIKILIFNLLPDKNILFCLLLASYLADIFRLEKLFIVSSSANIHIMFRNSRINRVVEFSGSNIKQNSFWLTPKTLSNFDSDRSSNFAKELKLN